MVGPQQERVEGQDLDIILAMMAVIFTSNLFLSSTPIRNLLLLRCHSICHHLRLIRRSYSYMKD